MIKDKINEDFDFSGYIIKYKNKIYDYGNRYKNQIELYDNGKFYKTVLMNDIDLIRKK